MFVIAATLVVGAVAGGVHYLATSSGAYAQAMQLAMASPEVRTLLGDNLQSRFPAIGFSTTDEGGQFCVFTVRLSGSRGTGNLYGVANAIRGVWEFSRLSLHVEGNAHNLNLAPQPRRLSLPTVPAKKVYLIPVDLESGTSLDWAPAYYKAKLGIDIEVLSPISADGFVDSRRHQLNSGQLVEGLRKQYAQLLLDPATMLIAVTSRDMYIPSLSWSYAENMRADCRFAVISDARLRLSSFLDRLNPEWSHSRLQKMLTKNLAMMYFDLPMSSDYTSLLSGGVLSGHEVDLMSGSIIGAEGEWDSFIEEKGIEVSTYAIPSQKPVWHLDASREFLPHTSYHIFSASVSVGLFLDRTHDFILGGNPPLAFTRVYMSQDSQPRAFGIGANDSLDIFLTGQMFRYVDLSLEDGTRIHFSRPSPNSGLPGNLYVGEWGGSNPFSYARATFSDNLWTVERKDGWKFFFPYKPKAIGANVTVLTGFIDNEGHKYEMLRNEAGDLLSVTTPSGQWLHFERDDQHRVHSISDPSGRKVTYKYDPQGRLVEVTDSDGHRERYTYDERAEMRSIAFGSDPPYLKNDYDISGNITRQELFDGEKFEYHYTKDPAARGNGLVPELISTPNGLLTYIQYERDGYTRSLPLPPPY